MDESEQVYEKFFDPDMSLPSENETEDILGQVLMHVIGNAWLAANSEEDLAVYIKRTVKTAFNSCISSGAFEPFKFEDIALVFEKLTGESGDTYEDEWSADFQSAIEQNKQFFEQ